MESSIHAISLTHLSLALIPVVIVLVVYLRWSLQVRTPIYALARMFLQLMVIGYFLTFIFALNTDWPVMLILGFMVLASSWMAFNTLPTPNGVMKRQLFARALVANFIGGGLTLVIITQGVLQLSPWYQPQYMIPLAGMVFASTMTSISLVAERFFSETQRGEPFQKARDTAFQASMIPTVNALFATGLVALPGMMTGQILSGVDPLIAARYQIMVMLMLFSSAGIASAIFLVLNKPADQALDPQ